MNTLSIKIIDNFKKINSKFEFDNEVILSILSYKEFFKLKTLFYKYTIEYDFFIKHIPNSGWCNDTFSTTLFLESTKDFSYFQEYIEHPLHLKLINGLKDKGFSIEIKFNSTVLLV